VVFAWLFDSSPWWRDVAVLAAGLVIAVVAHASRLRFRDGSDAYEPPPPEWPELKRPPDENELL
jgi:hypothetical protein